MCRNIRIKDIKKIVHINRYLKQQLYSPEKSTYTHDSNVIIWLMNYKEYYY